MKIIFFLFIFLFTGFRAFAVEQVDEVCDISTECNMIKSIRLNTFPSSKLIKANDVDEIFSEIVKNNDNKYEVIVPYKYPKWQYFDGKVNPFYSKYKPNEEAIISIIIKEYNLKENSRKIVAISSYVRMRSSKRDLLYWSDFGGPVVFNVENKKELLNKFESYFNCMYDSYLKTPQEYIPKSCEFLNNKSI